MVLGEETPREILSRRDSNATVGEEGESAWLRRFAKAEFRHGGERPTVKAAVDPESGGEFARPGAETEPIGRAPSMAHRLDPGDGLEGAKENKACFAGMVVATKNVCEPVDSVIEIDISRAGFMAEGKGPRRGPREEMAGRIADLAVGFGLEEDSTAISTDEFPPDQIPGAGKGIAVKKLGSEDRGSGHRRKEGRVDHDTLLAPPGKETPCTEVGARVY